MAAARSLAASFALSSAIAASPASDCMCLPAIGVPGGDGLREFERDAFAEEGALRRMPLGLDDSCAISAAGVDGVRGREDE